MSSQWNRVSPTKYRDVAKYVQQLHFGKLCFWLIHVHQREHDAADLISIFSAIITESFVFAKL